MTTPTPPLSPAAQAVWDAWNDAYEAQGPLEDMGHPLAAALIAAAEQMPSDYPEVIQSLPEDARRWYRLGFGAASNTDRSWLSALATELRQEGRA
jgi:hypothetical protein